MGQGDNQVITIQFAKAENQITESEYNEDCVKRVLAFKRDLVYNFNKLGLPLKSKETWTSNSLFAYGKHLYFKSNQLSVQSKKLSRLSALMNESFPSIDNVLASLGTTTESATSFDLTCDLPLFWYYFMGDKTLSDHYHMSLLTRQPLLASFI